MSAAEPQKGMGCVQKVQAMDMERWRALEGGSLREVRKSLMSDPWPSALARGRYEVEWSLHPRFPGFGRFPGHLLMGQSRFANGHSATLVYGCASPGWEEWSAVEGGPWTLGLDIAARCGDEAEGSMLACFEAGPGLAKLCSSPAQHAEDSPELNLGPRTAVAEARDLVEAIHALDLLTSLPSSWDEPAQMELWRLTRTGEPGSLAHALEKHPEWAWRRWSRGSAIPALACRLGRWGAAAEASKACPPEKLSELADLCGRALAEFCCDWAPICTALAVPKALLRAWGAGLCVDAPSFVQRLSELGQDQHSVWAAWTEAETLWLDRSTRGQASARGSKRI